MLQIYIFFHELNTRKVDSFCLKNSLVYIVVHNVDSLLLSFCTTSPFSLVTKLDLVTL